MEKEIVNKNTHQWVNVFLFTDGCIIFGCEYFWFIYVYQNTPITSAYIIIMAVLALTLITTSLFTGVYRQIPNPSVLRELRAIITAWIFSLAILTIIAFVFKVGAVYSRFWFTSTLFSCLVLITLSRLLFRKIMNISRGKKWNFKNIIIIGNTSQSAKLSEIIEEQQWSGLNITKIFKLSNKHSNENPTKDLNSVINTISKYISLKNTAERIGYTQISQVWVILEDLNRQQVDQVFNMLDEHSVDIIVVPNLTFIKNNKFESLYAAGIPVIIPRTSSLNTRKRFLKNCEDYLLATLILILASPLFVIIAVGIKLSSPGPVLYRQKRITLYGKPFEMLKFRSMPVDAESQSGPVWAKEGENRATAWGAFLRRSSLDELPQFFNVLKGEMSIVGPRPERPEFVVKFKKEIPGYMKKHLLKAGITGWAQVNGFRGNTSLEKRIEHDIYYINNWSLVFDLRIMLMTFYKGFFNSAAY